MEFARGLANRNGWDDSYCVRAVRTGPSFHRPQGTLGTLGSSHVQSVPVHGYHVEAPFMAT